MLLSLRLKYRDCEIRREGEDRTGGNERKMLKVSLKFISFTLIPVLGSICRLSVPLLHFVCHNCSNTVFDIIHLLIFFTFVIEPIVLVYIHNILNVKFYQLLVVPVIRVLKKFTNFF